MLSINRSMAIGAGWMVVIRLMDRSLGLVSVVILARLLVPADFGLVAMATAIMALVELFGAFGFDAALIRLQHPTKSHFDTAWSLNVVLGIGIAIILIVAAPWAADAYGEVRLPAVMATLALGTVISALENIGVVEFRRSMNFQQEFRFQLAKRLATFLVTIPAAILLRNYWALVGGMVAAKLVTTLWSYKVSSYRPGVSFTATRELVGFSKWLLINNLVGFFKERGFDFIVGRVAGVAALGTFNVAYSLGNLPTAELAGPINRAVFPGYARMANDADALRSSFVSIMGVIALFVAPAGVGMAAVAPWICAVLLGPKWTDAIPVLQIIAVTGAINTLQTNMYSVYLAINKPNVPMWTGAGFVATLLLSSIWLTADYGLQGTAYACLFSALLFVPVNYGFVLHYLKLSWSAVIAVSWRPIVGAAAVWGVARWIGITLDGSAPAAVVLLAAVAGGGLAYLVTVAALWWLAGKPYAAEITVINQVTTLIRSRLSPQAREGR